MLPSFERLCQNFCINNNYMGITDSSYSSKFYTRYAFIQLHNDANFGVVKIYRKKQLNFDYVMIIERHLSISQLKQHEQQLPLIHKAIIESSDPLFLRLLHFEFEGAGMECGQQRMKIYMEYLNFSIRDAINHLRSSNMSFTLAETLYIIHSAIQAHLLLKSINANYLSLKTNSIFITTDGYLRFIPVRIDQQDDQCCQTICSVDHPIKMQKTERQFLIELKNLLIELISISPNDDTFHQKHQLLSSLSQCRTLQHFQGRLPLTDIDAIVVSKKAVDQTDSSTHLTHQQSQPRQVSLMIRPW